MADTPRSQKNRNNKHKEQSSQPLSVSKAMEAQMQSLHRAFLERQGNKPSNEQTADKFVEFVSKQSGGKNILSKINASGIKVYFDNIQQQGTALSTIATHTNHFRHVGISQAEELDHAYGTLKRSLE